MELTLGQGALRLLCRKCTREEYIPANTKTEAIIAAIEKGWVKDGDHFVCPKCPAVRSVRLGR